MELFPSQKMNEGKLIIQELKSLEQDYPIISDKALLDLINGIQVNGDLISYHRKQSVLGRVIDIVSQKHSKRQGLARENFHITQKGFLNLFEEIVQSLNVTQVGLLVAQESLYESRQVIRNNKILTTEHSGLISQLMEQLNTKSAEVESEITKLKLHLAANEEFERIILKWEAGQSYNNLPWPIELILLSQDIFRSIVGLYGFKSIGEIDFREKLVSRFLKNRKDVLPSSWFSIKDLLDHCYNGLDINTVKILSAVIQSRSIPLRRLIKTPNYFMVSTTLELASLEIEKNNLGDIALQICNTQISSTSNTYDAKDFIEEVVNEISTDNLYLLSQNQDK